MKTLTIDEALEMVKAERSTLARRIGRMPYDQVRPLFEEANRRRAAFQQAHGRPPTNELELMEWEDLQLKERGEQNGTVLC